MGGTNPHVDPANVVQALVHTLLDVFEATRDLHQTLKIKETRDYERALRSKGYPTSRTIQYVEEESLGCDEDIVMDKAAVTRQFEIGYETLGMEFATGDVLSQTSLQSEIIALQGVLVTTFLYGPTSSDPISYQLSRLNAASRAAGSASVDILATQLQRQQEAHLPPSRSVYSKTTRSKPDHALPYPVTDTGAGSAISAPSKHHEPPPSHSGSHVRSRVLDWREDLDSHAAGTELTDVTARTANGPTSTPRDLYCPYALDLQRHPTQPLSQTITSSPVPSCPHCQATLHVSPSKAWEVFKDDDGLRRCFRVSSRFVAKCHREGPDGQYACVMCSQHAPVVTVCGDVKALIKHVWEDHDSRELKHEEDVVEVVEQARKGRRDSVAGSSWSSRRSRSWESGRRRKSLSALEREGEGVEGRAGRRGGA